jgi:anti-sigma B factor antagonist
MHLDLQIDLSQTPPLAELTVQGELDFATTEKIDQAIDRTTAGGCTLVALDLHDVTFIDCAGISALVKARHRLDAGSSHLWVIGLSRQVARMMALTGTDALFGVSDLAPARRSARRTTRSGPDHLACVDQAPTDVVGLAAGPH